MRIVISLLALTLAANAADHAGSFVYDPISRSSTASTELGAAVADLKPDSSFTIEAFAKPEAEINLKPREFTPVFKSGDGEQSFIVGIRRSPAPHSYHWWQARISGFGKPIDLAKPRYNGLSMVRGETPWRHLAFVWDSESLTAKFYLDYRLQAEALLESAPNWDVASLVSGEFAGKVDALRVKASALEPWDFQRATQQLLKDVSFEPETNPALPADYGHVDVRLHYGAVGDGVHDDTEAIRRAFEENDNRVPIEYQTVYFPAGTYLITDSIRFSRFMVVRGAGRDKTTIRLKDQAPGYDNPEIPKPAFAVGYDWPYVDRPRNNRAGNVIGNYIFDLSIETGSGNPAALGLDFHCNNIGCVENVDIKSGDGAGLVGLDLRRPWPGPCLIKNVSVSGFDRGVAASSREYSLVFSNLQLRGQREVAIDNAGNVLSMENVLSENTVPAISNRGGGLVVMINSELKGGSGENIAIESKNASLYLRDVEFSGYAKTVRETKQPKDGDEELLNELTDTRIDEYFTGPFDHAFNQAERGSLKMEIKQTPEIPRPPVEDWVNVLDFQDRVADGDWAPAIQAAADAGKPLVYFPAGPKYEIKSDVNIGGNVRTFFGGSPKVGVSNGHDDDPENGPAFVLAEDLSQFQFDLINVKHVRHQSPTTLIFRHCRTNHISAGEGCGDLFIEDTGGPWRFSEHQRVWGRQLNPETKGVPEIINDGGQFWVLGLKTEYLSTKIENRNGAQTEVLGGLMYPVHPVEDESIPMFVNEDSSISLIHGVSVYKKNHKIYMRDTQAGETREFREWRWQAGRPLTNLYRSSKLNR
ncbi:MAG: glycosyl hydrolase family 28-related protein [Verrucomicrobiota bacterium]